MKFLLTLFISLLFLVKSDVRPSDVILLEGGNECGSLGSNAPVQAKDCQIFTLSDGYCCYMTATRSNEQDEYGTACVILKTIDQKYMQKRLTEYSSKISGDILIQCSAEYFKFTKYIYYYSIAVIAFILF